MIDHDEVDDSSSRVSDEEADYTIRKLKKKSKLKRKQTAKKKDDPQTKKKQTSTTTSSKINKGNKGKKKE